MARTDLPTSDEWKKVMEEVERRRLMQEAELRQKQVQAQLEAELIKQQTAWNAMQNKAWIQGTTTGRFSGKKATMTIIDDPYGEMEYKTVADTIWQAVRHIKLAHEGLERMRDWRYRSPYHPKRWIRWLQKRKKPLLDTLIFGPLVVVALWFAGWGYWKLATVTDYYVATIAFWIPIAVVYAIWRKTVTK